MPQRTLIKGGFVLSMDPHVGNLPVGDVFAWLPAPAPR
jgi:hypothetical protein